MKIPSGGVRHANGIPMTSLLSKLDSLSRMRHRFRVLADCGEGFHERPAIRSAWSRGIAQNLRKPLDGQCRKVLVCEFSRALVVTAVVVRVRQVSRRHNTEAQVPELAGNVHRPGATRECQVQFATPGILSRHEGVDPTCPTLVS